MPSRKANILVVFYSRVGSVEVLAKAVSEGAREAGVNGTSGAAQAAWALPGLNNIGIDVKADQHNSSAVLLPARYS